MSIVFLLLAMRKFIFMFGLYLSFSVTYRRSRDSTIQRVNKRSTSVTPLLAYWHTATLILPTVLRRLPRLILKLDPKFCFSNDFYKTKLFFVLCKFGFGWMLLFAVNSYVFSVDILLEVLCTILCVSC